MDDGRRIELSIGGIVIGLGPPDPNVPGHFMGGVLSSSLKDGDNAGSDADVVFDAMMDGIESIVLSHAVAGVDVTSPDYLEGLQAAVNGCAENAF